MIKQEERRVEPILRAEKLTKRFGELTANREIDIEIHAGEIHAIAGENGAGKKYADEDALWCLSADCRKSVY